jgi:hypothetical protein
MITIKARHWTLSLFVSHALLVGTAYAADLPAAETPPPWGASTANAGEPSAPTAEPVTAQTSADNANASGASASTMEDWYRNRRQKMAQSAKPTDDIGQLQASAEKGDARAQYALAMLYRSDESGKMDINKSLEWHKRAAEAGYDEAQYGLGVLYANGQYVPQDIAQAQSWFQKAADQGNEAARLALQSSGNAAPVPEQVAVAPVDAIPETAPAPVAAAEPAPEPEPVVAAAEPTSEPAQVSTPVVMPASLSAPVAEEPPADNRTGASAGMDMTGIAPDAVRQSADSGDKQAQLMLGTMYEDGLAGLPSDLREAAYWYEQAARQDYPKAQYNLGLLYEDGRGVKQNYAQAAYWYDKASKAGFTEAQNNLGVLYASGNGVKKDPKRAEKLFSEAAGQGNANAKRNLGLLKGG